MKNKDFDLNAYVSQKIVSGLKVLKKKHGIDKLCITRNYRLIVDVVSGNKPVFYFNIEIAK